MNEQSGLIRYLLCKPAEKWAYKQLDIFVIEEVHYQAISITDQLAVALEQSKSLEDLRIAKIVFSKTPCNSTNFLKFLGWEA